MKDDKVYVKQRLEAIEKINVFTAGQEKDNFLLDAKTQSATIMQLMLIGELSKKISVPTKDLADLPWKDIAGFRDRAIHDYFEVDLEVVWNTVIGDLPILKTELEKLV